MVCVLTCTAQTVICNTTSQLCVFDQIRFKVDKSERYFLFVSLTKVIGTLNNYKICPEPLVQTLHWNCTVFEMLLYVTSNRNLKINVTICLNVFLSHVCTSGNFVSDMMSRGMWSELRNRQKGSTKEARKRLSEDDKLVST